MKLAMTFTRRLWDSRTADYIERTFSIEIDPEKIKPDLLHKALRNKGRRAQALNGAVVIHPSE